MYQVIGVAWLSKLLIESRALAHHGGVKLASRQTRLRKLSYRSTTSLSLPGSSSSKAVSDGPATTNNTTIVDDAAPAQPPCEIWEAYFDFSPVIDRVPDWKNRITKSMLIYPSFVTAEEEKNLLLEIEPGISRLQYETAHWDDAIHHYRETERKNWNKKNELVINRIRNLAFPPSVAQLQLVHVLDLGKSGVIKPHIDSVRFCGSTIAGLSLLSNSVMRLVHDVHKDHFVDVYLPRYSLYVMSDLTRYEFTHEILGEKESVFLRKAVPRDRRVSIMCRNEPETPPDEGPVFKSTQEL